MDEGATAEVEESEVDIDASHGLKVKDREQRLTNFLIVALEKGDIPWERGWEVLGAHYNVKSGKRYSGSNAWLLPMVSGFKGWSSNQWGTFNNWREASKKHNETLSAEDQGWFGIKKGETATSVVQWKVITKNEGTPEEETIFFKRWWDVFNREQTGMPAQEHDMPDIPLDEREVKLIEALTAYANDPDRHTSGTLKITRGGDSAHYNYVNHEVVIPDDERFTSVEERVNVWAHEMFHSTGKFYNRKLGGGFGSKDYAAEELRAEMGAALICAEFGFDYTSRNNLVAYIGDWLKRLKSDKTWLEKVSRATGKGVNLILNGLTEYEETKKEEEE